MRTKHWRSLVVSVIVLFSILTASRKATGQTLSCKQFQVALCVDSANTSGWSGSDIGGWINSAYAALPTPPNGSSTNGPVGKIIVVPNANGGAYHFSTPISLSTSGKPVQVDFQGALLNYTGASGTAITLDWGQGFQEEGGMWNLKLTGPCTTTECAGVTAIGINLGPSNGFVGGFLTNVDVGQNGGTAGFYIGIKDNANTAYIWTCNNCIATGNNIGYDAFSNSGVVWNGGGISQNVTGVSGAYDLVLNRTTFGDNGTAISGGGSIVLNGVHMENISLPPTFISNSGNLDVVMVGGIMQEDSPSGSATCYICAGATGQFFLNVYGTAVYSGGMKVTDIVQSNASVGAFNLQFVYQGGNSQPGGGIITNELEQTGNLPYYSSSVSVDGYPLAARVLPVTKVAYLPSASSYPGAMAYVTDSTAISAEGQACSGGSSNKALAFSNGSVWKCF